MLPTRAIVAASLSVFMAACAEPPKRVNPVGLSFAAYEDTARRSWTGPQVRPLATAVWYPAAPGSRESEWRVGIFNAGWNAQKAPLSAATTKRALVRGRLFALRAASTEICRRLAVGQATAGGPFESPSKCSSTGSGVK